MFNDCRSAVFALRRDSKKPFTTRTRGTECSVQSSLQRSGEKGLILLSVFCHSSPIIRLLEHVRYTSCRFPLRQYELMMVFGLFSKIKRQS